MRLAGAELRHVRISVLSEPVHGALNRSGGVAELKPDFPIVAPPARGKEILHREATATVWASEFHLPTIWRNAGPAR
jgi:hypothetical protein